MLNDFDQSDWDFILASVGVELKPGSPVLGSKFNLNYADSTLTLELSLNPVQLQKFSEAVAVCARKRSNEVETAIQAIGASMLEEFRRSKLRAEKVTEKGVDLPIDSTYTELAA